MNHEDYWTLHAMRKLGGSFVSALGVAGQMADDDNLARMKAAWPEYWAKYEALSVPFAAKAVTEREWGDGG